MKPKKLEIGDTTRWNKEKRHIVSFLEDDGERLVVFKVWRQGGGWRYSCTYFKVFLECICLYEEYPISKREKLFELNGLVYGEW